MPLGMRVSQGSVQTGWPDSAWKVAVPTKRVAASVITTCTAAPSRVNARSNSAAL